MKRPVAWEAMAFSVVGFEDHSCPPSSVGLEEVVVYRVVVASSNFNWVVHLSNYSYSLVMYFFQQVNDVFWLYALQIVSNFYV